jgi:hypothetical protein
VVPLRSLLSFVAWDCWRKQVNLVSWSTCFDLLFELLLVKFIILASQII